MASDKELTYSAYFNEYKVENEEVADIIECVKDGVCPLCKTDHNVPIKAPEPGESFSFKCGDCALEVSVEAWWVK